MDWEAIGLSLKLAAATTAVLMVLAAPLAAWLALSRGWLRNVAEAVVGLPLVLPPTVLGFYLLVAFGPRTLLGNWYERVTGERLAFSFMGLLVASVLFSLPFAVQPMSAAFAGVDRKLVELARTLGCSWAGVLLRVLAPIGARGIAGAAVLVFAHTLGEFGVVLMVGGNIAGRTRTASIAVYDAVQTLEYGRAHATALFLIGCGMAAMLAVSLLRRGSWAKGS